MSGQGTHCEERPQQERLVCYQRRAVWILLMLNLQLVKCTCTKKKKKEEVFKVMFKTYILVFSLALVARSNSTATF